jgi:hypothetical protein
MVAPLSVVCQASRRNFARIAPPPKLVALVFAATWALAAEALGCDGLMAGARGELGTDDNVQGMTLGVANAGGQVCVTPALRVRASALFLAGLTASRDGRTAGGGAGGELALRLLPFPRWFAKPYASLSAGLLFFPLPRFLPGGDAYEFMLSLGAGVEIPLFDRLFVAVGAHWVHLSNGQGLGPFNPAFSGAGFSVEAGYRLDDRMPADVWTQPVSEGGRDSWAPGVIGDASYGRDGGAVWGAGRVRLAERVGPGVVALLDVTVGRLTPAAFGEVGLGIASHWPLATAGFYAGYRNYAGLTTSVVEGQLEAHATDEVSLLAMGVWENTTGLGNILRSALGIRAFPLASLLVDFGLGVDSGTGDVSPYFTLEWQIPLDVGGGRASLFIESQVSSLKIVGLRYAWGVGPSLRDRARKTLWLRLS